MFRQSAAYLLGNVVSAIFGFALVALFTRILAPAEYGFYIVGVSFATMTSALCFGWIKASIVPLTADGTTDLRVTATLAFAALATLGPIAYLVANALAPDITNYILPAFLLAVGIGFFEFHLEVFRSRQNTGSYVWATIVRAACALALTLVFVLVFNLGGMGLIIGSGLAYLLTALLFSSPMWRRPIAPYDPQHLRDLLAFGLPMTVSGFVFLVQTMLDRLVVAAHLGEEAAGLYGAGADLVRQIIFFPGVAIGTAIAPIAISLFGRNDLTALNRHMTESAELLLAVVVPCIAGLALVAPVFVALVLGEQFRTESAALIPVIALAWLFRTVSYQLLHVSFQMSKLPRLLVIQGATTLGLNTILLLLLVPAHGLMGAAWSVVIAEALGMCFGYFLTRWSYRLPLIGGAILRVGTATLVMTGAVYAASQISTGSALADFAVQVITGVAAYLCAAYALNLLDIRERLGDAMDKMRLARERLSKP